MPDRNLTEHIRARLAAALSSGAPLKSPLPSQARYAQVAGADAPGVHVRSRQIAVAGVALTALVVLAIAGPPQSREWLVQSVSSIANDVIAGSPSPTVHSPSPSSTKQRPEAAKSPDARETPEANETPDANESPEPSQTPESHESPEPAQSPEGGEPSGGDGGGEHSSPDPSPGPSSDGSDG